MIPKHIMAHYNLVRFFGHKHFHFFLSLLFFFIYLFLNSDLNLPMKVSKSTIILQRQHINIICYIACIINEFNRV